MSEQKEPFDYMAFNRAFNDHQHMMKGVELRLRKLGYAFEEIGNTATADKIFDEAEFVEGAAKALVIAYSYHVGMQADESTRATFKTLALLLDPSAKI